MLRALGIVALGVVLGRAHAERAMRHDHQLRPARAVLHAVGEHLAGTEQPVVGDEVDALAQFDAGGITGPGNQQHVRKAFLRHPQAIRFAECDQPFVAQPPDALGAHHFDACRRGRDGLRVLAHALGTGQIRPGGVEIALLRGRFRAADQGGLHRTDAKVRAHLPGSQPQCITERVQRAARRIQCSGQECAFAGQAALARLFGGIDRLQVRLGTHRVRPQGAQDGGMALGEAQRGQVFVGGIQGCVGLSDQCGLRALQQLRIALFARILALQCDQDRDRRCAGLEQVALLKRTLGGLARGRRIIDLHRRQAPAEHAGQRIVATDADAAGRQFRLRGLRGRRHGRLRPAGGQRQRDEQGNDGPACAQTTLRDAGNRPATWFGRT
jgi:hypothetical protein